MKRLKVTKSPSLEEKDLNSSKSTQKPSESLRFQEVIKNPIVMVDIKKEDHGGGAS